MTPIVAIATLLLFGGIIAAIVKRLFRLAVIFTVVALLIVGGAVYVIATMH